MPRTSGTRVGVGAGWGGPAKGESAKRAGPGRPKGVKNGQGKRTVAELMVESGARELTAQRWLEILNDPAHPKHADMVAKAADRMDGAPTQNINADLSMPGALVDAPPPETREEWLARRQREIAGGVLGAATRPAD
jgi:hypothetical protein